MKLAGQTTIWADQETVWAALHDADVLAACIPGCLSLKQTSPDRFDLSVLASAGPISAVFDGSVEIMESIPPMCLHLRARGGGPARLDLVGSVRIVLSSCPAGSRASWEADMQPGGLILRLTEPFLTALAQRQIDQFARAFAATVGRPPASGSPHTSDRPSRSQPTS